MRCTALRIRTSRLGRGARPKQLQLHRYVPLSTCKLAEEVGIYRGVLSEEIQNGTLYTAEGSCMRQSRRQGERDCVRLARAAN